MGRPLVVIADADVAYVEPLEVRFLEELAAIADIEVITDESYFAQFLSEPHDIEALLVGEEWFGANVEMQNISKLFVLSDSRDAAQGGNSYSHTFKYESLSMILGKVTGLCPSLKPAGSERAGTRVVVFFSPVGGAGTTTLALATAANLQAMYKKVLYVDAEYIQTFKCMFRNGKDAPNSMVRDMNRLSGDLFQNMQQYLVTDGFDYLPPLRAGLLAFGLEFDFFERFVEAAKESGKYDYIVVDTDSVFNAEKSPFFSIAANVVVPVLPDATSVYKAAKFLDNLDRSSNDKYRIVCNCCDSATLAESPVAELGLAGQVERIEDASELDVADFVGVESLRQLAYSLE